MRSDIIFHDIEQGSPEWYALRMGRVTGTSASELIVNGKGADGLGVGAWSLIYQLSGELITGESASPQLDTYWTERGKQLEHEAIEAYMEHTFRQASRIGFISWGDYAGCSPDFGVDETTGGEVKCLSAKEHIRYAHTREIEKKYMAQVQWCLFVTGFQLWHYVHYHPKAGNWSLIIDEIAPDQDMHDKFTERLEVVSAKIQDIVQATQ